MPTPSDPLAPLRRKAEALYHAGRVLDAVHAVLEAINASGQPKPLQDLRRLALYLFTLGDLRSALTVCEQILSRCPDDVAALESSGVILGRLGAGPDAVARLERVVALEPDRANAWDALARTHGLAGDLERARECGARSLAIKTRRHPPATWRAPPPAPFDGGARSRNVIAFSLWGREERYLHGALENARLAPVLYPEWTPRFYCDDSVPPETTAALVDAGADVVLMPPQQHLFEGLFWRFRVLHDEGVDRFLIRDCDSVISLRERAAVDEWLAGDRHFHVMRDFYTHSELILAGLWGGVGRGLPDTTRDMRRHLTAPGRTRTCDQAFLREVVWPRIAGSVLIHDSVFGSEGARPFPPHPVHPAGFHVGGDHHYRRYVQPDAGARGRYLPGDAGVAVPRARDNVVFTLTTGRSGTAFLARLVADNALEAEVHHERTGFETMGVTSPDASTFMLFNSAGNCAAVQDFWRRKFATLRHGHTPAYVETSHFLAKAGLLENLRLLGAGTRVGIVVLTRDTVATAVSLADRFDFANTGFTWLFNLDPRYPRNVVPADYYAPYGVLGSCVWYCHEMAARTACYRHWLADAADVNLVDVALETLREPGRAARLLDDLGLRRRATPTVPAPANVKKQGFVTERERDLIRRIHEDCPRSALDWARERLAAQPRLGGA